MGPLSREYGILNPQILLEVTSPLIKVPGKLSIHFSLMIHSGMVSSVTMRAHAALVPTLHHGSVPQVMILRYVFVLIKVLLMKILQFNCLNCMSSKHYSNIINNVDTICIPITRLSIIIL